MINALIVDDDMATVEVVRNAVHWKQLGVENVSKAYNIEQSNVDMTTEFVQMIATQRGFQANSKGITTVDTMLETVIGMKR